MKVDHRFLSRLLSERPGLSIQEKESALEAVLTHIEREEPPQARPALWRLPRLVTFASLAALVAITLPVLYLVTGSARDDEFLEKGTPNDMPLFSVKCVSEGGVRNLCRPGNKLVFNVHPPKGKGHFSAFAKRESDGLIIWYFPETEGGTSYELGPSTPDTVLSKGVVIGDEHTSGNYQVYGIFSERPATRKTLKSKFDDELQIDDTTFAVSTVFFIME